MASSSSSTSGKSDFKWTDDKVELLLNVMHNYKIEKITENVDWESVKTTYDNILALMKDELPSTADEAKEMTEDYPHTKEKVLSTKLKAVRGIFRKAIDSGRRSGHGRVVLLYYELCEKIWGGSPATQQVDNGIEVQTFIMMMRQILPHQLAPVVKVIIVLTHPHQCGRMPPLTNRNSLLKQGDNIWIRS